MFKNLDLTTIVISLFAILSVLTIFRFCKCKKTIENFQTLVEMINKRNIKEKLHETFVDKDSTLMDHLDELNTKTLDMMGSIKKMKDILTSSKIEEEIEVTEEQKGILDEFNSIKLELEEENDEDDEVEDDEVEDDLIEGFIEHSTHNCSNY